MSNVAKTNERPKVPEGTKVPFRRVVRFGLSTAFKAMPVLFIIDNIHGILTGFLSAFALVMTQRFFDSVEAVLAHNGAMSGAYLAIAGLGLILLIQELLGSFGMWMHVFKQNTIIGELTKVIHAKMGRIDPVCLEDPRLHDDINKAQEGARMIWFIEHIGTGIFTFYLPFFIFMSAYLYYLKPQFIVSMVLIFIPTLAGQLMRTKIISKFEDKAAPIRREFDAHEQAVTNKIWFKETRILGGYTYFLRLFADTMHNLGRREWQANRKTNLINLGMNALTLLGHGGIIYMLFDALLKGEISVGAFAAVYGAIGSMFSIMDQVQGYIGDIAASLGSAHNLIRFMDLPERGGQFCERKPEAGIVVEGASFRYPNAEADSVTGINLHIRAGETIAIVGENGAGKTTLARLLTGIYKPSSGRVLLCGMDTGATDAAHLFDRVSGVFQKYQRYQMTLADNIRISDFGSDADINQSLSQAGVAVDGGSFPNGHDTMLSREFEGVDLSGGEWQRVAIARGLYRAHDTILLDEPTAAIDPLEESRIYRQFIEMSKNKTAIIITHRLGSTQIADRVLVMHKGRIVGDGTHESLMADCPLYRDMFNAQAEWYNTY
jgi:ATP-binding cassette subfamily B protein